MKLGIKAVTAHLDNVKCWNHSLQLNSYLGGGAYGSEQTPVMTPASFSGLQIAAMPYIHL